MKALALLFILIIKVTFVGAIALTDSSLIVSTQPDSVTKKIVYLLIEATELTSDKPLIALKNYRKALTLNKTKDAIWEADIRLAMGKLLYQVKSPDAIPQLLKAEALYKKKSHAHGRAAAIEQIAKIQEASGQFDLALKNYNDLYNIQYKMGEQVQAGNTASHLTDVFTKKQNFAEAFKYADLAKNAYYSVCKMDSLGSIYYKIASLKRRLKAPKSAEYYILSHALSYYRSSNNLQGRLKSFDFLGSLYLEQKRYSEAKWFYLQANNQARLNSDTAGTVSSLINLGLTKILIGDLALAKQDITEAELIIEEDSTYAPIMIKAKAKYPAAFKKLNAPVVAKKPSTAKTNKETASTLSIEKKKAGKDSTLIIETIKKTVVKPTSKTPVKKNPTIEKTISSVDKKKSDKKNITTENNTKAAAIKPATKTVSNKTTPTEKSLAAAVIADKNNKIATDKKVFKTPAKPVASKTKVAEKSTPAVLVKETNTEEAFVPEEESSNLR